ncbi:hypothetical protein BH10PSE8_BH10PSE8_08630 [soil metagenome]
MRVTFDSNAWEVVFDAPNERYRGVRQAVSEARIEAYICEIGFRIEAIRKIDRRNYFSQPHFGVTFGGPQPHSDGKMALFMSMGPKDELHPGVPSQQRTKLHYAFESGAKLLRAQAWMGLPSPPELRNPEVFLSDLGIPDREGKQILAAHAIEQRGFGKKLFDEIGGWSLDASTNVDEKKFQKACAEWADGETVAAHVAYGVDILCTNDCAKSSTKSIFSCEGRSWLESEYRVKFMTLDELQSALG